MALTPYDPFNIFRRDFGSLPRVLDQWFDEHTTSRVRVDVRETQNEVIVTAEIPGLEKKEDVQITIHDNHLHLNGKIERVSESNDENIHRSERYYGQFSRTIPLPRDVDEDGARASYRNGILEVRLQKTHTEHHRQIDVDFH
ncbi:Hsp20/alpha crystallin family protein [Alicyclobacillus dauci]|uniref:Hsp20/alpha crystallin family protein n=1 Tax=Alicyclobacillus dauci TaxID=1475485 RepID=A0ABY6Z5Z7_9BACL|nr:Hsp20/alpha crystallin family protein [Alicyclobacillus dauci]WAH38307.1 Hsp20/alpha crystallin family protein [Alicyclobacillus dauci]